MSLKLNAEAKAPYRCATWGRSGDARKWLADCLEEGYVLVQASGSISLGLLNFAREFFLVVRYDPNAARSLIRHAMSNPPQVNGTSDIPNW